jgi:hypothetical protein
MDSATFTFATREDIERLGQVQIYRDRWSARDHRVAYRVQADGVPWNAEIHPYHLDFPAQFEVTASHVCPHDAHAYYDNYNSYHPTKPLTLRANTGIENCPFFVYVNTRDWQNQKFKPSITILQMALAAKDPFVVFNHDNNYYNKQLPPVALGATVEWGGCEFILVSSLGTAQFSLGATITEDMRVRLSNGTECDFPSDWKSFLLGDIYAQRGSGYRNRVTEFDYTADTFDAVNQRLWLNSTNQRLFLRALIKAGVPFPELKQSGVKKTLNRLQGATDDLIEKDPMAFLAMRTLIARSGQAVDGVKISVVFNEVFKDSKTAEDIEKAMETFYNAAGVGIFNGHGKVDDAVKALPIYKEKRKAVLKSQANRAFTKVMQEAESLSIDKKKYKRTWKAIEEGRLPIGTFFRKSEQYFLLNDNWALWEEMFKRGHGEKAIELANEVKGRTTYEKDLMSYLYFVLYGLPAYLKKHTGHKWTCTPKLVTSSEELEPPKEDDSGVTRSRSALTPIVDNEAKTVEVPYASLCIYGYRANTYCYSHDYHVLQKGFSINGNVVMEDIEKGLNGRDDYGLMFYTLTGSAQGRGYPTFLIIFERRTGAGDTRVHFHRTHPSRSKDGDYNPIHRWIAVCFNWAMGNVNYSLLKAQQGDLFFIAVDGDKLEFDHEVNSYDHHCFETAVKFAEYKKKAKSNILGYVQLDADTLLRHNEHDDVMVPSGTYAIHQCRSWEANPKGVWSLNID